MPGLQRRPSQDSVPKKTAAKRSDDLRPEYDLALLKNRVRGKYHRSAGAGTNLVLIDPDLATLFPDSESVNRALRVLANAAQAAASKAPRRRSS